MSYSPAQATAVAADIARAETLIDEATAANLSGPEWQLNLAVCDLANAHPAIGDAVVRALQNKLQSTAPRTVLQTLLLVEAVVKNGAQPIHALVATRTFLHAVAALSDGSLGSDVQAQALVLIKQWADAFAGSPLTTFQDVYRQLKLQGVDFPELEHDAPVFTPPRSSLSSLDSVGSASAPPPAPTPVAVLPTKRSREQQLAKLHADLDVVMDRIAALRQLWANATDASGHKDAVDNALDFLRQCQPRMNTLIEGGIMGKIDEKTLETCLTVNDHLIKALEESSAAAASTDNDTKRPAARDMISFDSPPRATRSSSSSSPHMHANLSRLSLQESPPLRRTSSTFAARDDDFDDFLNSHAKQ